MPTSKPKTVKKEDKKVLKKDEEALQPIKPVEEPEAKEGEKELDPDLILAAAEVKEDDIEEEDADLKEDEEDENEFGPDELNPFGDKWEE